MPCPEFEERLLAHNQADSDEGQAVRLHTLHCDDCRAFLAALDEVDTALTCAFTNRSVSMDFGQLVLQRIEKPTPLPGPSWIPAVLDGAGLAGFLAILLWLTAVFVPGFEFGTPLAAAVGTVLLGAGFGVAYRCYGDLRRC